MSTSDRVAALPPLISSIHQAHLRAEHKHTHYVMSPLQGRHVEVERPLVLPVPSTCTTATTDCCNYCGHLIHRNRQRRLLT